MKTDEAREHYRFFEHTADLGLEARGPTREAAFEALALGLMDTLTDGGRIESSETRMLELEADDPLSLLQHFLQEVLLGFELDGFACSEAEVRLEAGAVHARLRGEAFDPERHGRGREVKAVTHHGISLETTAQGVEARVLLDI